MEEQPANVVLGIFWNKEGELLRKDEIPTRKDEGGSLILEDIKKHISRAFLQI